VSDEQPIDLDDLQRVGVKVRKKTDDNWLADMVEIACDEIARLREERRWVPVGERLPKPGETVLMLMDGSDPVSGWYENGHFHNAYDTPYVTHWMPLPPGPEGDG
jgi:hypothetical protein